MPSPSTRRVSVSIPNLRALWTRFRREEAGLELLEWAILALVFSALIAVYAAFQGNVSALVEQATTAIGSL